MAALLSVSCTNTNHAGQTNTQSWFSHYRVVRDQEPFTRLKKSRGYSIASTSEDLSFLTADLGYTWLIKTYMYLESNEYPDIYRLVCGQVWDGYSARRLYVREFEEAVGDYISINEGVSQ